MTASGDGPSIEERLVALARKALDQTRAGVMGWRTTDDPDAFAFSGTKTSLIIDHFRQDGYYEFRIVNEKGVVVEELARYPRTGVGSNDPWGDPKEDSLKEEYQLFADLHDAARRSAFDIDALLDSAFYDVETPPEPPEPPEEPPF